MKRPFSVFAVLFAVLFFAGCQHKFEEVSVAPNAQRPRLNSGGIVYVAMPPDAWQKKDIILESGRATAYTFRDTFAKYTKRAYVGRTPESPDEALQTARGGKCTYLIYPLILRWEDHSTELSGVRDKLEVKVEVRDVMTGELLDSTILKATSRWFTDGGDTPKDLLQEPVSNYVGSLFQVERVPTSLQ